MTRLRQIIAQRIWDVANWLYPYATTSRDGSEQFAWTMEATYIGTEADADELFAKLTELDCEGKHPLHDCAFAVGGMRREELGADTDD